MAAVIQSSVLEEDEETYTVGMVCLFMRDLGGVVE